MLLATAATLTPIIGAATWISRGTGDVVHAGSPVLLPAFVVAQSEAHDEARTVVLRPTAGGGFDYALVRDREPQLGDADLPPDPAQVHTVDTAVSDLAAGIGQRAAIELAHAGIRYVLAPVDATDLAKQLGVAGGVLPQNDSGAWRVWQVESAAGRIAFASNGSDEWQLPADPVGVGRHAPPIGVPYSPAGQLLVLAEAPSSQWQARSGGTALTPTTVADMQAFALPTTATTVSVSRAPDRRADWLLFQLVALLVVLLGAIPAGRRAAERQRLSLRSVGRNRRRGRAPIRETPMTDADTATRGARRMRRDPRLIAVPVVVAIVATTWIAAATLPSPKGAIASRSSVVAVRQATLVCPQAGGATAAGGLTQIAYADSGVVEGEPASSSFAPGVVNSAPAGSGAPVGSAAPVESALRP